MRKDWLKLLWSPHVHRGQKKIRNAYNMAPHMSRHEKFLVQPDNIARTPNPAIEGQEAC